jgi:hypothetical protein
MASPFLYCKHDSPEDEKRLKIAADTVLPDMDDYIGVQSNARGGIARVVINGEAMMFKLATCTTRWKKRWARRVGWNPARNARRMSDLLTQAGFAICPVARHGKVRLKWAPRAVWYTGPWFDNAMPLRSVRADLEQGDSRPVHPRIKALFADALKLLRRLHDAGFVHGDFHAGNVLVDGDVLRLVDIESIRCRRPGIKARAKDVERFLENFLSPEDAAGQVREALSLYAPDDEELREALFRHPRVAALVERMSRGQRKKRPRPQIVA